ncbi:TPA: hypothetical protein I8032_000299 [Legionella pneumophila]|nr:hypothetical protein [Legionella pneumophila]
MKGASDKTNKYWQRGNVMTPLNWMCAISESLLLPTAGLNTNNWLGVCCFVFFALIAIFYGVIFSFFALKDPDRLQSEKYNLESQKMYFAYQEKFGIKLLEDSKPQITVTNPKIEKESS